MGMSGLYERDALAWAEQQAMLLRRMASGEAVNEAVDWPNVIAEVRDVGLSELRACRSLLRQAIVHLLKLHAWPGSSAAGYWREEAGTFLADAEDRFTPSMRQRIGLGELYGRALHLAQTATDSSGPPRALPAACPFTLDELLAKRPDLTALSAKLAEASAP
jgi:hypothetical protein